MKQNKNYEKQKEITTGGVKGHAGTLLWFLFGFDEISILLRVETSRFERHSGQTEISLCRKQKR